MDQLQVFVVGVGDLRRRQELMILGNLALLAVGGMVLAQARMSSILLLLLILLFSFTLYTNMYSTTAASITYQLYSYEGAEFQLNLYKAINNMEKILPNSRNS